ncbi:MAG: MotA/TolQ/ExbB proton channel family protein [Verrucomicrobiales bacterium]
MTDMLYLFAGIFQAVPDAIESVWNFFYAGKLFMVFLLGLSLLSISVIIYKALDLRRHLIIPERATRAIEAVQPPLGQREAAELAGELRSSRSALGRLGLVALSGEHADREDASRAVEARAREEVVEMESGVALLEVVITIAPLLGLLGTVSGLVNVFSNLGDSADHSAIAIGIAEALNTTIAGLAIAVPTVVAHSFFMKKIEKMGVRMEILLGGLLAVLFREPKPGSETVEAEFAAPQETAADVGEIAPQAPASPQVYTAIPDPGASTYPEPAPPATGMVPEQVPVGIPNPVPEPGGEAQPSPTPAAAPAQDQPLAPELAFPRLLAGQNPSPPASPAPPEDPSSATDGEQPR